MEKSNKVFVGMDVHKESIDITLAEQGGEVRRLGQIGGDRGSLLKMVRKQCSKGRKLVFVCEAGPCGFRIYREIAAPGHTCMVVSPALQAMRGIQFVHAVTLVAELGDLTRFGSARQLMGNLGLVPRESSSGEQRRQGSITKAGNSYARRALIEAAWAYRHPARVTRIIASRQTGLPKAACDIAWRAQLRLSAKYRRMNARHVNHNKIVVARARELSGFVWAIGHSVKPQ